MECGWWGRGYWRGSDVVWWFMVFGWKEIEKISEKIEKIFFVVVGKRYFVFYWGVFLGVRVVVVWYFNDDERGNVLFLVLVGNKDYEWGLGFLLVLVNYMWVWFNIWWSDRVC